MKEARTSRQWWAEVSVDSKKFEDWLRKQYHGEVLAAQRVREFRDTHTEDGDQWYGVLSTIAEQEELHASWVAELLKVRGLEAKLLEKEERYWNQALAGVQTFTDMAATAAHAEQMRLERITVIVEDSEAPDDVREVFGKILPQEKFHTKAFQRMAGDDAMARALERHEAGMAEINVKMEGLIPSDF